MKTLLAFDIQLSKFLASKSSRFLHPVLLMLEVLGNGFTSLAICAYVFATSRLPANQHLVGFFLVGFFTDLAWVGPIKAIFKRRRPHTSDSYTFAVDSFSFPSGHASRAVYVGHFLLHNVLPPQYLIMRFLVVVVVGMLCVSRVVLGRHYVSDVVGGIVIGRINYLTVSCFVSSLVAKLL